MSKYPKVCSFKEEDVDICFIDFYSFGHFIFGFITNLIIFLIILLLTSQKFIFLSAIFTINIGLFWEFFENFYLHKKGFKYDNRQDSLANSLTDILFVSIGAIVCTIITIFSLFILFVSSTLILTFSISAYEVCRRYTMRNNRKNKK